MGSGAGIPGIVLKIERPRLSVVLLDSARKKVSFLNEAIARLGLAGIEAVQGRAEDPKVAERLGRFDIVVSRATWPLAGFLEAAIPYLAAGGRAIAMKGPRADEELGSLSDSPAAARFAMEERRAYELTGGRKRHILAFRLLDPPRGASIA